MDGVLTNNGKKGEERDDNLREFVFSYSRHPGLIARVGEGPSGLPLRRFSAQAARIARVLGSVFFYHYLSAPVPLFGTWIGLNHIGLCAAKTSQKILFDQPHPAGCRPAPSSIRQFLRAGVLPEVAKRPPAVLAYCLLIHTFGLGKCSTSLCL